MRIDGAIPPSDNVQTENLNRTRTSKPESLPASDVKVSDRAQLTSNGASLTQLKANVSQVPEIRQDRVQALQQAVNKGSYNPSSQQLADALSSDALAAGRGR